MNSLETCEPYSIEACKQAGNYLGKEVNVGDYGTKGCYGYKSGKYSASLWYGTGGTDAKNKETLKGSNFRPTGYDCKFEKGKHLN